MLVVFGGLGRERGKQKWRNFRVVFGEKWDEEKDTRYCMLDIRYSLRRVAEGGKKIRSTNDTSVSDLIQKRLSDGLYKLLPLVFVHRLSQFLICEPKFFKPIH